jgi:hypothetical protein
MVAAGDFRNDISLGCRIKLTHASVTKYFLVTGVAYASGNTTLTLYGGTDYTLASGAITFPNVSRDKAPSGFPLDPDKWSVEYVLTGITDLTGANPPQNAWQTNHSYHLITVPIGAWDLSYQAEVFAQPAWPQSYADVGGIYDGFYYTAQEAMDAAPARLAALPITEDYDVVVILWRDPLQEGRDEPYYFLDLLPRSSVGGAVTGPSHQDELQIWLSANLAPGFSNADNTLYSLTFIETNIISGHNVDVWVTSPWYWLAADDVFNLRVNNVHTPDGSVFITLSTSISAESDPEFTARITGLALVHRQKTVLLAAKTGYSWVGKIPRQLKLLPGNVGGGDTNYYTYVGGDPHYMYVGADMVSQPHSIIRAVSAYL